MNPITKTSLLGAAFAALLGFGTSAHAQLAMTYKLDVRNERAEQQPFVVNRCVGFNWMTSIGACGRELLARMTPGGRPEGEAVAVSTGGDLPDLGAPGREWRLLRSGGGREALLASSKAADLLFRFGSKFRVRGSDEGGWEYFRFTDVNYESHVKANGHKAVGVELLVPFQ